MKYIVKNCTCFNEGHPNLRQYGECLDLTAEENYCCADIENCLLKKIIEKCKEETDPINENWQREKENLAKEILKMFEIEEVE